MSRKYLVGFALVAAAVAGSWYLASPGAEEVSSGSEPRRPSPIDERLPRPAPRILGETVRTRAADTGRRADAQPVPQLEGSDWAVVVAIYKEFDAAQRRASAIEKESDFDAAVYPERGQGSKYMVVLGSGLTQPNAMEIRDRVISGGMPSDTYVTRLSPANPQPVSQNPSPAPSPSQAP